MPFKTILFVFIAIVYTTSPSYGNDIISCDSFENCPDGSEPLTNKLIQLENKINALEALLANVTRGVDPNTSQDTLTFTNMNVQVVSGSGETYGAITGTGNLIIGYNETGSPNGDNRTGSHMLVIGERNSYTSYGGMVAGGSNTVSGITHQSAVEPTT